MDVDLRMKKTAAAYIILCVASGLGLMVYLSFQPDANLNQTGVLLGIAILSVLGAIAESLSLSIDGNKAISISFAIAISALLMFGYAPAAWVAFFTIIFSVSDFGRGFREHIFNIPLHKSLMNASNYVLSILAVGLTYKSLGGQFFIEKYPGERADIGVLFIFIGESMLQILAGLVAYVLVNSLIIMFYFLIMTGRRPNLFSDWLKLFQWSLLSMFSIGMLGVFLAAIYWSFSPWTILLFFAPFMMFRYAYVGFTSIRKGYIDTIQAFSAALEAKDHYTIGHARRVEKYCEIIASEMSLSSGRTKILKYASLLHDIGKIGISENILNKADYLTDAEYEEIKRHPVIGAQMLEGIQFLKNEVKIIKAHHVHFDGTGYPADAVEEGKILEAQILAVADSFDAMTSDRAYRPAMSLEEAIDELYKYSGTQFAPEVVTAFVRGLTKRRNKDDLQDLSK